MELPDDMLECDICGKEPNAKLGFHCATCARSAIYTLRIEHAATLIDKESLGRRVEAIINGAQAGSTESITLGGMLVDTSEAAKATNHERTLSELEDARERIDTITQRAAALKRDMEQQKKLMDARKATVAQRRSDAESATHGLDERSAKQLEEVQGRIKHLNNKLQRTHSDTVDARVLLCREAASLAGLKLRKVRADNITRQFYSIGGLELFDLRNLNAADPKELSASLANAARLLVRVSQYLAVRLPAEITLPRNDYPLPTIFAPWSSYQAQDVPFPGSTPSQSGHHISASRLNEVRPLPRPRMLWVDKRLPQLSKDDPGTYSLFIEGVSFLAWDIAWLCKTQSSAHAFESWEDVCPLGKNLWQLLVADRRRRTSRRESSARDVKSASSEAADTGASTSALDVSLGQYSHGSAYSFLGVGEVAQYMRDWKLKNPKELMVKVRAHLIAEMQGAEWEVIDQQDELSAEEPDVVGTKVMIAPRGGSRKASISKSGESKAEAAPKDDASIPAKAKGMNGWTKLRGRNGDM